MQNEGQNGPKDKMGDSQDEEEKELSSQGQTNPLVWDSYTLETYKNIINMGSREKHRKYIDVGVKEKGEKDRVIPFHKT